MKEMMVNKSYEYECIYDDDDDKDEDENYDIDDDEEYEQEEEKRKTMTKAGNEDGDEVGEYDGGDVAMKFFSPIVVDCVLHIVAIS